MDEDACLNWSETFAYRLAPHWLNQHSLGHRKISNDEEIEGKMLMADILSIEPDEIDSQFFGPTEETIEKAIGKDFIEGLTRDECLQFGRHVVDLARHNVADISQNPTLIYAKQTELREAAILAAAYRALLRESAPVRILVSDPDDWEKSEFLTLEAVIAKL